MPGNLPLILMVAVAFAFMYFVMIRPANKRMREQQALQAGVSEGQRVMLTSGVFATVKAVGDNQLVIEIAPGVDLTVVKAAVAKVVTPDEEEFEFADAPLEGTSSAPADVPPAVAEPMLGASSQAETLAATAPAAEPVADVAGEPADGRREEPTETTLVASEPSSEDDLPGSSLLPESVIPPPAKKPSAPATGTDTHPTPQNEDK